MTKEQLAQVKPDAVFKTVIMQTDIVTGKMELLVFVAVKGGGPFDWAIYAARPIAHDTLGVNMLHAAQGDKIFTKSLIQEIVPCDNNMFSYYRY